MHMAEISLDQSVAELVRLTLSEDIGSGDASAQLVDADIQARARLVARQTAVLCGCEWFAETFRQLDVDCKIDWLKKDGDLLEDGVEVCTISARARALLSGERSAINLLQTLSATATCVNRYAQLIRDTKTRLRDTRKTIPGLRVAQKYATKIGGAQNHRMGLYDQILIKENHIKVLGGINSALKKAKKNNQLAIQIEVESIQELQVALAAGAEQILLDNFALTDLRKAVAIVGGRAKLEASGMITADNIRAVADTGVDYIAVGALTKNIKAVDFTLLFDG